MAPSLTCRPLSTPASLLIQKVTVGEFNDRIERRRMEQDSLEDMLRYHSANSLLRATAESEQRVQAMRRTKAAQEKAQASSADAVIAAELAEREARRKEAAELDTLARAVYDVEQSERTQSLRVKRVVDQSPELKQLKQLLAEAQTNRQRLLQVQEKQVISKHEAMLDALMAQRMEADRQEAVRKQDEEWAARQSKDHSQRMAVQKQIEDREERKRQAYLQDLREREAVDAVVQQLEREDQRKADELKTRRVELQHNIAHYLQERAAWRAAEKARAEEELRKIKEYNELQQKRMDEVKAKKRAQFDQQDLVLKRLSEEMARKRREQEEMEQLLQELYLEEAEQRGADQQRQREEKERRMRAEMIEANESIKALKAQRQLEEQREEQEFRQQMMDKFAADRRLEQLNAQRRRIEMANYRKEVDALIEERRRQREEAANAEDQAAKYAADQEAKRMEIVDAERKRLLLEHAPALAGYLPKGVLQTADDYKLLYGKAPDASTRFGIPRREGLQAFDHMFR